MAADNTRISQERLESVLGTIEMLQAMYYGDDELVLDAATAECLPSLEASLNEAEESTLARIPDSLGLTISIHPDESLLSGPRDIRLRLEVQLPLNRGMPNLASPTPVLHLRQPEWLSRSVYTALCDEALQPRELDADSVDDVSVILSAVERLNEALRSNSSFLISSPSSSAPLVEPTSVPLSAQVLRTWHYLPSLSTKSKRADLVTYAHSHSPSLTGFVLAGKPGLIVLEHPLPSDPIPATSQAISSASASLDAYWSTIKSRSWADIPASHKKVTERLREVGKRAFETMEEVTRSHELGGPGGLGGARGNRNEMARVAAWLESKGLEGRLEKALGAEW